MQRTKKTEKQEKQKSDEIKPFENEILKFVREYHFLTVAQLIRLHYRQGSLTHARVVLLELYNEGYLDRRSLPHTGKGQPVYIYALATKGINYLKKQGFHSFSRYRPNELQQFQYLHLEHVLYLNDFLIAGRNLTKVAPDITLAEMQHDLDLKRTPAKVTYVRRLSDGDYDDERVTLVPDAWLDFRLQLANSPKQRRKCIVVELDRGSETHIADFKKKIRAYVHYAFPGGAYEKRFGTQSITVVFATTVGEHRANTMRLWCEQELKEQRLEQEASLFRFTALPQDELSTQTGLDAKKLFLSDVWSIPSQEEKGTLLWKP
jgi:hypothetical protein